MNLFRSLAVALAMYSRIPVPRVDWDEKNMKYAMCFFPVVGVITGGLEILAAWLLLRFTDCGQLFQAAVLTLIPVAVTGGIHLDGFADTVDALSSYGDREKKLAILKDPHTGAFAVIGLCSYFLLDFALWNELLAQAAGLGKISAAACIHPLSRALSGIAVVTFPAAKNSGLLRTFRDGAQKLKTRIVLILWAVLAAAALLYISGLQGGVMLVIAALTFLYYYRLCMKQFGGTTGDLAGYFLQLCELGMLAGTVLAGFVFA